MSEFPFQRRRSDDETIKKPVGLLSPACPRARGKVVMIAEPVLAGEQECVWAVIDGLMALAMHQLQNTEDSGPAYGLFTLKEIL